MRITCPNCNAQYEIADGVIPLDGRDVQCSNCGTTWFQEGRQPEEADEADAAPFVPQRRSTVDDATREILREEREREEKLRGPAPPAPEKLPEDWDDEDDDEPLSPPTAPNDERARLAAAASVARARDHKDGDEDDAQETEGIRDAIVSALRAARTVDLEDHPADAKRAAAQPTAPERVTSQAKTRVVGAGEVDRFGNSPDSTGRRGLLPDIEKINSSLRPDEMEAMEPVVEPETDDGRKGGFRFGFLAACIVILLPVIVYLLAEPIKNAVPQTAATISAYQTWVDARRVDLEAGVEALTDRLTTPQS